jgi:hypothetical protein
LKYLKLKKEETEKKMVFLTEKEYEKEKNKEMLNMLSMVVTPSNWKRESSTNC